MSLHEFTLTALHDTNGKRPIKAMSRSVTARHPFEHYRPCPWIPDHDSGIHQGEVGASQRLDTAERVIHFMDATGLKPSRAWYRVFKTYFVPPGFDHTLVWHRDRRYIVTTEPYGNGENLQRRLLANGWTWLCLPGRGMWFPPHTTLYLCSPPKTGMELETIAHSLEATR